MMSRVRNRTIAMLFAISRSRVPKYLQEFRALEHASSDIVVADEQQRLSSLLLHASLHVPYYKEMLADYGIARDGNVRLDRFTELPILDKDTVQARGASLHSDDMHTRHPFENTSGGSTGSPARFIQDRAFYDKNVVSAKIIYNEYLGKYAGEPEINLWGSERDVYRGSLSPRERIINYIYNRRFLNAFSVTESDLQHFVDEINKHKPVFAVSYILTIFIPQT